MKALRYTNYHFTAQSAESRKETTKNNKKITQMSEKNYQETRKCEVCGEIARRFNEFPQEQKL